MSNGWRKVKEQRLAALESNGHDVERATVMALKTVTPLKITVVRR
jgi:hypothetical protein